MDGYLKIKTRLDNSGVDKGVAELENKIKKLQQDNTKSSTEQNTLQSEINSYELLQQKADEYRNKIRELKTEKDAVFKSNVALAFQGNMPEYEAIKSKITEIQQEYSKITSEIDKQAPKMEKVYSKLDKIKSKQNENNTKMNQYRQQIEQINLEKVKGGLDSVSNKIQSSISKIGKMAIAVFGIRTAFNAVRQAMNIVSQYNPQIAADFEYMRYCIANLLAPAVQGLINLLYTVLSYVNAIASAWFGINLFGNSSAKNFQKMQNSAAGTAKAVKEINKTRESFDEMNVLQDSSSDGSSGGGAGGVNAPSFDLSGMQAEVPKWLQWLIDNKELILEILAGITAGLISMRVLGLNPLMSLGIGLIVGGIVALVQDIIKFLKDPTWDNFLNIMEDTCLIITGICLILGLMTGNWIPLLISLIALVVVEVIKHWDEISEVLRKNRNVDI